MSQVNIIGREQAVYFGLESTFGATPGGSFPNAMTRTHVAEPVMADGVMREMLDVGDVRVRRLSAIQPVQGLELGSKVSASLMLKATPTASQLVAAATPGSLTPRLWCTHAFGAEHAVAGSLVEASPSPTTTSFSVTAGEGVNFRKGTYVVLPTGAGDAMEAALITNISADAITVSPAFSNVPVAGDAVRNLYNHAPAESHTNSLTAQVAYVGSSAAQYTFNGCYGDLSFSFGEWGKLVQMKLDLTAVSYTGPTAQGLSTATAADDMGLGFYFAPSVYLTAGSTFVRATTLPCTKFNIEYKNQWEMIRDPSATNTVSGVVNTGGRPRAVKLTLQLRFDDGYGTAFDAETRYSFTAIQTIGTGATRSFHLWNVNNCKLVAAPKLTKVGEMLYMDLDLLGFEDDAPTVGGSTGAALDHIYAPLRYAYG